MVGAGLGLGVLWYISQMMGIGVTGSDEDRESFG